MAYWFIFQNDKLLIHNTDSKNKLLDETVLNTLKLDLLRKHKIGEFNDRACYAAEINSAFTLPNEILAVSLRRAFELLDETWISTAIRAFSIINWDNNHQFCGRCGYPTEQQNERFERVCTHCGLIHYPRISPSIIVLIRREDHLLMARSPHFPPGIFGLIAGFVEPGENLEQAVKREVKEEVDLEIKNLSYFTSQAWPFPDSIMVGFFADYAAREIHIDQHEIETAGWYRYDKLPGLPSVSISISRRLIDHFVKEQQEKHR